MSDMKILIAASEALPFASTGGLGDVIGSLPAALVNKGVDVRVVMPLYASIADVYRERMKYITSTVVKLSWRNQYCGIFELQHNGVTFYFIDNEYYFKRQFMYGGFDDGERFAFFCKAILDIMPHIDFFPDILHTNDWQTALAVVYLKRHYSMINQYKDIKSVHTLHNIEYQGEYDFASMSDVFDISNDDGALMDYEGRLNLTKGAVVCCDKFTTVSPSYAEEIKTETFSHGLHHVLNLYNDKITGILNGIDTDYYKPKSFNADDLSGKQQTKADLQSNLDLPVRADVPVVSMITRLVSHKGLDLVVHVLEEFVQADVQFILLGTGDQNYENYFRHLAQQYPDKVKAIIAFDKNLAEQIYSGSDIFFMPSKSEPCGLAQMISSQYGTVPLVREVGGLGDSIKNYNPETDEGNGFTFHDYNAHDMLYTLKSAVDMFVNDKETWNKLILKVMKVDFSWNVSAEKYINLYKELILNGKI